MVYTWYAYKYGFKDLNVWICLLFGSSLLLDLLTIILKRMVLQNIKFSTTTKKSVLRFTEYWGANLGTWSLPNSNKTQTLQQR